MPIHHFCGWNQSISESSPVLQPTRPESITLAQQELLDAKGRKEEAFVTE